MGRRFGVFKIPRVDKERHTPKFVDRLPADHVLNHAAK